MEKLTVRTSADLIDGLQQSASVPFLSLLWALYTHRRVQIDEDGAGNVFAAAGLGEEGLEGTSVANVTGIGVRTTVSLEAMLEQVPEGQSSVWIIIFLRIAGGGLRGGEEIDVQLPGAVSQLGTSLADVKVADLGRACQ